MAEKTSKQLNIAERFTLLAILQAFDDFATYKIVQKLSMTLAPNEKESKEYDFENLYRCPHVIYDEDSGARIQCEFKEHGKVAPKCPVHSTKKLALFCEPTGFLRWKPEVANKTKEIFFGPKAKALIVEKLNQLNEQKQLKTDTDISLYIKFIESEKEAKKEEEEE